MITIHPGRADGTVSAPPSKSHTHRAYVLAALSGNGSIRNGLQSDDTQATLDCLQGLGFLVSQLPHETRVGGHLRAGRNPLHARESGTTLRLMLGVASLLDQEVRLTGSPRLRQRPVAPLLHSLKSLGVAAAETMEGWTVRGPQQGGTARLPGSASSQFVSSLLLSSPLARATTQIRIEGPQASQPYIDITLAQMRHHGLRFTRLADGYEVPGGQAVRQRPYRVPGDYSAAAFLLCAAAVTGGRVTVQNLAPDDPQGDRAILDILRAFGARVRQTEEAVQVEATQPLVATQIDVGATPDLFPILCALGAVAHGTTLLHGAPHLRDKESDRIRAMAVNLRAAGIEVQEREDGMSITGGIPKGISIQSHGDHRIAMACSVLALASQGASNLPDEIVVSKSYPNFLNDLGAVAAQVARS